jgi:fructose-bisphosphate aldolase class I
MANDKMMAQISGKDGFIAALDQSGGSTPGALRLYGIPDSAYSGDAEMFRLVHEMRVRIMTAPAFTGAKVLAAILFEATMDGQAREKPVPTFLWEERGVIPFLNVDKGLVELTDEHVRFRWKDYRANDRSKNKVMTLAAGEFMRRS